jgi:hypothetical protein
MSRLLNPQELEHQVELVTREARKLLEYAAIEHERVDRSRAKSDPIGEQLATQRLARIARALTRAQAHLVHPDDDRYEAARAVIGYCDEADKNPPWRPAVPPVRLGEVA